MAQQGDPWVGQFQKQVERVMGAIRAQPKRRRQILTVYFSNFFSAVKETLRKQGRIVPIYIVVADPPDFGVPPVTEEIAEKAKEIKAEAVIWVEGFQWEKDISDVIYHVSISSPCLGVMGWVMKVKLGDAMVEFVREMPYHFDSPEKVKSLGELIAEVERP